MQDIEEIKQKIDLIDKKLNLLIATSKNEKLKKVVARINKKGD